MNTVVLVFSAAIKSNGQVHYTRFTYDAQTSDTRTLSLITFFKNVVHMPGIT